MIDFDVPAVDEPGEYALEIDLVIEGVTWFADRGTSETTHVTLWIVPEAMDTISLRP